MSYSKNPHLPKVRRDAVQLIKYRNWSMREVARHFGVEPSTVSRWCRHPLGTGWHLIPTKTSRPYHHPHQLSPELIGTILGYRQKYRRCAKVLHFLLSRDGHQVSLSSVERVLRRCGLVNHSPWKKWHQYPPRPLPEKPGILVQIDTIIDGVPNGRLCVYTLLDVCSRWSWAWPVSKINTHHSFTFVKQAQGISPFRFQTLQSDHGSEFSKWFTKQCLAQGFAHRHSRVRTPSDNGHLERFNRTLQEECLNRVPRSLHSWQKEIPDYLRYYNAERPHMALNMKSPIEVLRSY